MTRILLVDDEPLITDSLSYSLKREGFDVKAVGDGPDALQEVEEFLKIVDANYGGFLLEFFSLINGKRTIKEIISLLSLIQWKIPQVSAIFDYLKMIEYLGLIEMKDH